MGTAVISSALGQRQGDKCRLSRENGEEEVLFQGGPGLQACTAGLGGKIKVSGWPLEAGAEPAHGQMSASPCGLCFFCPQGYVTFAYPCDWGWLCPEVHIKNPSHAFGKEPLGPPVKGGRRVEARLRGGEGRAGGEAGIQSGRGLDVAVSQGFSDVRTRGDNGAVGRVWTRDRQRAGWDGDPRGHGSSKTPHTRTD